MDANADQPYEQFRATMGRDGPDFKIVERLNGEQRDVFIQLALDNIEYYNLLALGLLNAVSATPTLRKILMGEDQDLKLAAARALWDIEESTDGVQFIADYITDVRISMFSRLSAIGLLTNVRHEIAYSALESALFDEEYLIRVNAACTWSYNSKKRTSEETISRNLMDFNRERIKKLADKLRNRI